MAALEEPYAPHPEYAPTAAPEEVKMMRPWDLRRAGSAGLIWSCENGLCWIRGNAHKSYGAEEVDIKDGSPFFRGKIDDSLHRSKDPMIDYETINLGKRFQGDIDDLGAYL
jgi:hypothetical protein